MNSIRQKCRPKHQVLILRCYPPYQKNALEVKPNSSELSYLLYYASTRRSKLQKVGAFLEKRTVNDVWRVKIGNVQVTLQILKALIEKTPRDLSLYSSYVLRILANILQSKDITMIEASVETFDAFCTHQDPPALAADREYIRQFEEVITMYAAFASKDNPPQLKSPPSFPLAVRYRTAGLAALKSVATSDSIGVETQRQLDLIEPVILENLHAESGAYLDALRQLDQEKDDAEKDGAFKRQRRHSMSTVRTFDETDEPDPVAAAGTTEIADKLAEQKVGLLALQCLEAIFAGTNRSQVRFATSIALQFISERHISRKTSRKGEKRENDDSWPTVLFGLCCGWTAVQDRFVILLTIVETLIRSPIVEDDLGKQLVFGKVVERLLESSINFVGLSVMDVLVGLVQHILLLLQLGDGPDIRPHTQGPTNANGDLEKQVSLDPPSSPSLTQGVVEVVKRLSPTRKQLLEQVQRCIGALAKHVYYTDQISDMVLAILIRLKPPSSSSSADVSAIEDPSGTADAVASSGNIREKPHTDGFFSFDTARLAALTAVKDIITVANASSSGSISRSHIDVTVWEGTEWLLRDPNWNVRKAYADALLTWLRLELKKDDFRAWEKTPKTIKPKNARKPNGHAKEGNLARRAISNASQRDRSPKRPKSTFLPLLHLAVYENAHQYAESEMDILLLHLLLAMLVQKLGVNAVRTGLPMMMRLQSDIPSVGDPVAKINLASLVLGYLSSLSDTFDFEASGAGRQIHAEIVRRRQKGTWLHSVQMPPRPLHEIGSSPASSPIGRASSPTLSDGLRPFDDLPGLVDRISTGYSGALYSPPTSPPSSPGRRITSAPPILLSPRSETPSAPNKNDLPQKIKDAMLEPWSREECIAAAKPSSRSISLTNSRSTPTSGTNRGLLAVQPIPGVDGERASPNRQTPVRNNHRALLRDAIGGGRAASRHRSPSFSPSPNRGMGGFSPSSNSSAKATPRVEDLKRILSSSGNPKDRSSLLARPFSSYSRRRSLQYQPYEGDYDEESDSLASTDLPVPEGIEEEGFFTPMENVGDPMEGAPNAATNGKDLEANAEGDTRRPRPSTSSTVVTGPASSAGTTAGTTTASSIENQRLNEAPMMEKMPPVPPLPESFKNEATPTIELKDRPRTGTGRSRRSSMARRSLDGRGAGSWRGRTGRVDVRGLLEGIEVDEDGTGGKGGSGAFGGLVGRAPY